MSLTPSQFVPPPVLTIAGSDPSGGAGIQADLKTFHRLGVYGQSAVTLITAQNTCGVTAVHVLPPELVIQQIDSVLTDIGARAIKTGALGSAELIRSVTERLRGSGIPLVVDPVLISKHGHPLASPEAAAALHDLLLLATVIMPNRHEIALLAGRPADTVEQAHDAAQSLIDRGVAAVLLKGAGGGADDVLLTATRKIVLPGLTILTRHLHGTGCTYAAAVTAHLARGLTLAEAAGHAKAFIAHAIVTAPGLGSPMGYGPVNHWA